MDSPEENVYVVEELSRHFGDTTDVLASPAFHLGELLFCIGVNGLREESTHLSAFFRLLSGSPEHLETGIKLAVKIFARDENGNHDNIKDELLVNNLAPESEAVFPEFISKTDWLSNIANTNDKLELCCIVSDPDKGQHESSQASDQPATFKVTQCLSNDQIYTNKAYVNGEHASKLSKYVEITKFSDKHYVFTLERDDLVPCGTVAFNLASRTWANLQLGDELTIRPHLIDEIQNRVSRITFDASLGPNIVATLNATDLAAEFIRQYENQVFSVGQIFAIKFQNTQIRLDVHEMTTDCGLLLNEPGICMSTTQVAFKTLTSHLTLILSEPTLDVNARVVLIRQKLEELLYTNDIDINELVQLTANYTKSEIRQLIRTAQRIAMLLEDPDDRRFRIEMADFIVAIRSING